MMGIMTDDVAAAVRKAVADAIERMGVAAFKRTSFFGSNELRAADDHPELRNAA
jgi:hypothetical protein